LHHELAPERWRNEDRLGVRVEVGGGEEGVALGAGGLWGTVGEDLVLGTVWETIGSVVDWSALEVGGVGHVISFIVRPVHRIECLGAHAGPGPAGGVEVAHGLVVAAKGSGRSGDGVGGGVLDVALEGRHVHLIGTSNRIMDPEPRANTLPAGTSRKRRDVESLELTSDAVVDHTNDDEVGRRDGSDGGLVGNSDSTTCHISVCRSVDIGRTVTTHVVRPGVGDTAIGRSWLDPKATLSHRRVPLVPCDLEIVGASCGELSDGGKRRRVVYRFISVHPPIYKIVILQWLHGPIRRGVARLAAPHGRHVD